MKVYFSYVNARRGPDGKRGIYGRQIVWKYYDDVYNPVNSVQLTRKLVEEDKVFAVVGSVGHRGQRGGTPVPELEGRAAGPGVDRRDPVRPGRWKRGPARTVVGRLNPPLPPLVFGLDIKQNHTNAKIAILYQNDSYGRDYT